jgi:hypothetical protein
MFAALFVLGSALMPAQTPVPAPGSAPVVAPAAVTHANDMGFSYNLPSDWDVKDIAPALPALHQQLEKSAANEGEKKGAACVEIPLIASHGSPKSVIEVVTLGFDCFGQKFTDKDLPAFAIGVAGGMKKTFTITDPTYGAYSLGTHSIWIERAQGTLISRPETKYTVETVCGILRKGAVCWTALASDDTALRTFEHGSVTLEGETAAELVPATAFAKK